MANRRRIGMGLVGPGFVARHHLDAVRRLGNVDVIAIAGSSQASAARKSAELGVAKAYGHYQDLIADPLVEVVHNTTPNHLHFKISMAVIEAGKHVVSDKPLAMSQSECIRLRDAAEAAGVVNAVTFNYRGSALAQQTRLMIAREEIGRVFFIHGQYLQDWMVDHGVYSWRCDPHKGGPSSALADIGSHWCDLAQHLSGSKIVSVLAELTTVVKTRYASNGSMPAFSGSRQDGLQAIEVGGEDLASVLLRFENGAKGCFSVGQVIAGHKNSCHIELSGRTGSIRWDQETENELWVGRHDAPNLLMGSDPVLMIEEARPYNHLPGGHQKGWSDAFRNVLGDIYAWIEANGDPDRKPATVCTFADATQICRVIEAMMRSHHAGGVWEPVQVDSDPVFQSAVGEAIQAPGTKW